MIFSTSLSDDIIALYKSSEHESWEKHTAASSLEFAPYKDIYKQAS